MHPIKRPKRKQSSTAKRQTGWRSFLAEQRGYRLAERDQAHPLVALLAGSLSIDQAEREQARASIGRQLELFGAGAST